MLIGIIFMPLKGYTIPVEWFPHKWTAHKLVIFVYVFFHHNKRKKIVYAIIRTCIKFRKLSEYTGTVM